MKGATLQSLATASSITGTTSLHVHSGISTREHPVCNLSTPMLLRLYLVPIFWIAGTQTCPGRSDGVIATIDGEYSASDKRGGVGQQPRNALGYFSWFAVPPYGMSLTERLSDSWVFHGLG
jgi:hypothetical protein